MIARVLIVEDEVDQRQLLTRALRGRGFEVEAAESLREAREALIQGTFDVVVGDYDLGSGTLYDLLDQEVLDPERLVVVTGRADALEDRGVPILTKPFEVSDLVDQMLARLDRAGEA